VSTLEATAAINLPRADGSIQVTYVGLPLYYWVKDTKAGDVTGNGVGGFSVAGISGGTSGSPAPSPTTAAGGY